MVKKKQTAPAAETSATPRKSRGFLRASTVTTKTIRQAGSKRGFAEMRLLTEWPVIVGEALAGGCRPLKVGYSSRTASLGATLHIATDGARATEIMHQKEQIIERVNQFYGYRAVSKIRIDQSRGFVPSQAEAQMSATGMASAGLAEEQALFEAAPPRPAAIDGVADDGLRRALGRLGASVKAKAAKEAAKGGYSEGALRRKQ
ncbi:MAG: DUF721 domain-containing protein [Pikeienuella sp.]